MTPEAFGVRTDGGVLLPRRVEAYRRALAALARLWDAGIDPSAGPLPESYDPVEVPLREGHGTTARRTRHTQAGEKPCRSCEDALDRYRYPHGHDSFTGGI